LAQPTPPLRFQTASPEPLPQRTMLCSVLCHVSASLLLQAVSLPPNRHKQAGVTGM
jgi:hypothetical protein